MSNNGNTNPDKTSCAASTACVACGLCGLRPVWHVGCVGCGLCGLWFVWPVACVAYCVCGSSVRLVFSRVAHVACVAYVAMCQPYLFCFVLFGLQLSVCLCWPRVLLQGLSDV